MLSVDAEALVPGVVEGDDIVFAFKIASLSVGRWNLYYI